MLTVELIEWAFFTSASDSRAGPSSAAYRRIRRLVADGYVRQLALPAPPGGGSLPRILVLDSGGLAATDARAPDGSKYPGRPHASGEVGYPHLRHALAASQAWAALVAALRPERILGAIWKGLGGRVWPLL